MTGLSDNEKFEIGKRLRSMKDIEADNENYVGQMFIASFKRVVYEVLAELRGHMGDGSSTGGQEPGKGG
jgi:hypothetical protein